MANCIVQTPDGGFLIGGAEYNYHIIDGQVRQTEVGLLLKVNSQGKILWSNTYTDYWYPITQIIATSDGGYAFIRGDNSIFDSTLFYKLNSNLTTQWEKSIPITGESLIETTGGGYIIAGNIIFPVNTGGIYWIDSNGRIMCSHAYIDPRTNDDPFRLGKALLNDSGIVLCGMGTWLELLNLDFNGKIISQNICAGSNNDQVKFMLQTSDGGYLIIEGWASDFDMVYKVTANGDNQGEYQFNWCTFSSACKLSDCYLVAGYNETNELENNFCNVIALDESFKETGKIETLLPSAGLDNMTRPPKNDNTPLVTTGEIISVSSDETVLIGNKNMFLTDGFYHSCIWLMKINVIDNKPVQTFLVQVAPLGDQIISNPSRIIPLRSISQACY
jgi:hypothetical protein